MFKKIAVAALVLFGAVSGIAAQTEHASPEHPAEIKTLTGVIVDRAAYNGAKADAANSNKSAKDICMQVSTKLTGVRVALVADDGEVYTVIGDYAAHGNAKLVPHLCHTVTLTGEVTGGGSQNIRLTILATALKMVSK